VRFMTTEDNLKTAFAGESQANRRYLAFAKKADEEGLRQVARLFRAAAEAETVHALNHLRAMGTVKGTKENLKQAIAGETYEFKEMYPPMVKEAEKEGKAQARVSFAFADKVEKVHADLYKKALEAASRGKDLPAKEMFVCPVCGNTFMGEAPGRCPICGTERSAFKRIE